jgi:hypothetical protein
MAELKPKLYQPGTHPRDLRKLREQAEVVPQRLPSSKTVDTAPKTKKVVAKKVVAKKVVPQGLPTTGMVDTAPKNKKVFEPLKISTQK